jgi:hypothetical protein
VIGKQDVHIPDVLPTFLRQFEVGKTGSAVYIYDLRGMPTVSISPEVLTLILDGVVEADAATMSLIRNHPVTQFFRFMKSVLPMGTFFLTYELTTAGIKTDKDGMFFSNRAIEELKIKHNTKNPVAAIYREVGTAGANAKIELVKGGMKLWGVRYISSHWKPFCELSGPGTCLMRTDVDLFREWHELNNKSARREVLEVGISYPRLNELTPEEKEEDRILGADPWGLKYIWQD